MKTERSEDPKGQGMVGASRKRVIIIAAILIVVAGAAGLWLIRQTHRGNLAGWPVPTPDFVPATC
jgi:hypothetical protein